MIIERWEGARLQQVLWTYAAATALGAAITLIAAALHFKRLRGDVPAQHQAADAEVS